MKVLRLIVLLMFTCLGVWAAFWGVSQWAISSGEEFQYTREAIPLLIPVGLIGAFVGAFLGAMIFPARR